MGQFTATEVDMGIAFPTGSLADLFVQLLDEGILFVSFPQGFCFCGTQFVYSFVLFLVIEKSSFLVLNLSKVLAAPLPYTNEKRGSTLWKNPLLPLTSPKIFPLIDGLIDILSLIVTISFSFFIDIS